AIGSSSFDRFRGSPGTPGRRSRRRRRAEVAMAPARATVSRTPAKGERYRGKQRRSGGSIVCSPAGAGRRSPATVAPACPRSSRETSHIGEALETLSGDSKKLGDGRQIPVGVLGPEMTEIDGQFGQPGPDIRPLSIPCEQAPHGECVAKIVQS